MNAIGIVRVSSVGQKDKYGPAEQRDDIIAKGKSLGYEVVDIWEYQESATDASARPQFQGMLERLVEMGQAGEVHKVIFGRPDRLSRDGEAAFLYYMHHLEEIGRLEVRFGRDDVEPGDTFRNFKLFLHAFKAKTDADTIKLNTAGGRYRRTLTQKLLPTGSKNMFGYIYKKGTGKREIDPVTNPMLKRIGMLVLNGTSMRGVCKIVGAENDRYIALSTISAVLRNPAIMGKTQAKLNFGHDGRPLDEPVLVDLPDVTPPTFTEGQFKQLQVILSRNPTWSGKQRDRFYPLSGMKMVICARCGLHYTGSTRVDRRGAYRTYRHTRSRPCANKQQLSASKLEEAVWRKLTEYFADPEEAMTKLAAEVGSDGGQNLLRMQLRVLDDHDAASAEEKRRLDYLFQKGRKDQDEYEAEYTAIEALEQQRAKRREGIRKRLVQAKIIKSDELPRICQMMAVGAVDSHTDVEPLLNLAKALGDKRMTLEFTIDGRSFVCPDPEQPSGRKAWEMRRKAMTELGCRIYLDGDSIDVSVSVPVSAYSGPVFTKTRTPSFSATRSISPEPAR